MGPDLFPSRPDWLTSGPGSFPSEPVTLWDISIAWEQVCRPDTVYSQTEWCDHKERGGCCVGVHGNWDDIPGYKHMSDFCDKQCKPDGPGDDALCEVLPELKGVQALDPYDAVEQFYASDPDQCGKRINPRTWSVPDC